MLNLHIFFWGKNRAAVHCVLNSCLHFSYNACSLLQAFLSIKCKCSCLFQYHIGLLEKAWCQTNSVNAKRDVKQMQHCNMYRKAFYSLSLASVLLLLWCLMIVSFLFCFCFFGCLAFISVAEIDQLLCFVFSRFFSCKYFPAEIFCQ